MIEGADTLASLDGTILSPEWTSSGWKEESSARLLGRVSVFLNASKVRAADVLLSNRCRLKGTESQLRTLSSSKDDSEWEFRLPMVKREQDRFTRFCVQIVVALEVSLLPLVFAESVPKPDVEDVESSEERGGTLTPDTNLSWHVSEASGSLMKLLEADSKEHSIASAIPIGV